MLGAERKITLSDEERERTAYHESGHAVLGMLEPGADPVRKVSIVPRGRALGVTFQSPSTDRYGYDARYLEGRIVGALGGRAAEELIYGNVTTGAESDLEQVTSHRAPDGRALGHVGRHRPRLGDPGAGRGAGLRAGRAGRRSPTTRASWSIARCGGSSRAATTARGGCSPTTATGWSRWRRRCSRRRRSTRTTPTARPASSRAAMHGGTAAATTSTPTARPTSPPRCPSPRRRRPAAGDLSGRRRDGRGRARGRGGAVLRRRRSSSSTRSRSSTGSSSCGCAAACRRRDEQRARGGWTATGCTAPSA